MLSVLKTTLKRFGSWAYDQLTKGALKSLSVLLQADLVWYFSRNAKTNILCIDVKLRYQGVILIITLTPNNSAFCSTTLR